jgi:predicted metal-binding membrane protein
MATVSLPAEARDTPRSAYGALERRATLTIVAMLLALAGVAWWLSVRNANDMSSMVQGIAQVGAGMPFDVNAVVFMGMWTTMMVAMMFPTIAPIVLLHRVVVRERGEGLPPTIAFGAGYILIWAVVGLVPLFILIGFRNIAVHSVWIDRAGGGVLILAGAYQFTRWKATCLRACRTPLTFLLTHDFSRGVVGALRVGISHGLYCFGCCWALMAVLFVVGLMNLVWMAAIAVVFLAEKNWRHGVALSMVAGTAVLGFGVGVLIDPSLLGAAAMVTQAPSMMMSG